MESRRDDYVQDAARIVVDRLKAEDMEPGFKEGILNIMEKPGHERDSLLLGLVIHAYTKPYGDKWRPDVTKQEKETVGDHSIWWPRALREAIGHLAD